MAPAVQPSVSWIGSCLGQSAKLAGVLRLSCLAVWTGLCWISGRLSQVDDLKEQGLRLPVSLGRPDIAAILKEYQGLDVAIHAAGGLTLLLQGGLQAAHNCERHVVGTHARMQNMHAAPWLSPLTRLIYLTASAAGPSAFVTAARRAHGQMESGKAQSGFHVHTFAL